MRFNILKASILYGGGPSAPEFHTIHTDVSADFVQGFFQNVKLDKNFQTAPDSMGCYDSYKIVVSKLTVAGEVEKERKMGDYSQGHFRFALKKDAPREIEEKLQGLIRGEVFEVPGRHGHPERIYLGNSAHHRMPTFAESSYPECEEYRRAYCLTFQIKYGCRQLQAFADWLGPHVVVDTRTHGFFGYSISEYSDTPTVFLAHSEEGTTHE